MKIIILALVVLVLFMGCISQASEEDTNIDERYVCEADSDCVSTCGASCVAKGWAAGYSDPCVNVRAWDCSCVEGQCYTDGSAPDGEIMSEVKDEITNFDECIAAGNPAMESYPRQCRDPINDRTFIEEIKTIVEPSPITYSHPANSGIEEKDCFDSICVTRDITGPLVFDANIGMGCGVCGGEVVWYNSMDKSFQQNCVKGSMSEIVGKELCFDTAINMWGVVFDSYSGGGPAGEFSYTRTLFVE